MLRMLLNPLLYLALDVPTLKLKQWGSHDRTCFTIADFRISLTLRNVSESFPDFGFCYGHKRTPALEPPNQSQLISTLKHPLHEHDSLDGHHHLTAHCGDREQV